MSYFLRKKNWRLRLKENNVENISDMPIKNTEKLVIQQESDGT